MARRTPLVSMVLLVIILTTSYYCIAQPAVSAASGVRWSTGSDAIATIGANGWCEMSLSSLEPNATTVYTDALEFTLFSHSSVSYVKLEIGSVSDSHGIIWGVRFCVFQSGTSTTIITLVDGGSALIDKTNGNAAVCVVGYRQKEANLGYGETTTPVDSEAFTGTDSATYKVAVEVYGKDGILSTQAATLRLELVWFQQQRETIQPYA
jgi:hypothetical protein